MDKQPLKKFFDDKAKERDKWTKRSSYYHKDLAKFIKFTVPAGSSILDIGCSTGDLLASLPFEKRTGVDFSPETVKIARSKYPDINFYEMDAEHLSLPEKYDYIILSDVVGFFDDVQKALDQLNRVSHARSKIVITYYSFLWEPALRLAELLHLKMKQPVQNWLSKNDLENLLNLAGFETVKKGERLLLPKYIPLISAFFNKFLAKLPLLRRLCLVNYIIGRPKPRVINIHGSEPSVTVVIPARNEKGNIEEAVKRVPGMGSHTEIIFVEGHSTDDTLGEMNRVKALYPGKDIKILMQEGKGKGDAVRKGFAAATGDILMILDADLTVRPEELPKFYKAIADGTGEFINGSRLVYQLEDDSMRILNIFGNKFFSLMFSWLLDQRLKDTLCGTKVLRREDYALIADGRAFFGDFDPFGDYDLLFGAAKINLKILDLPIRYQARTYGATNISRFRHGWLLLKMCFFAMRKIKFI